MNSTRLLRNQWDRAAAVVAVALGFLALFFGWLGVSDSTLATEQLPYLASGLGFGMFFLGVGGTLWLSADLRDTWRKLHDVHAALTGQHDEEQVDEPVAASRLAVEEVTVAEPVPPAVSHNGRRTKPVTAKR